MSDSPFPPDKRDDDESRQATDGRARSLANLRPPWKPGETPNPEGRNGRVRIEEFRRWADDKATDKSELTRIQNVWNALYATAIDRKRGASHVNAGKIFVEQYQGKPTTPVEVAEHLRQVERDRINTAVSILGPKLREKKPEEVAEFIERLCNEPDKFLAQANQVMGEGEPAPQPELPPEKPEGEP